MHLDKFFLVKLLFPPIFQKQRNSFFFPFRDILHKNTLFFLGQFQQKK